MLNFETFLYKNIGAKIKKYRDSLDMTQDQFAAKLNSDYYISLDRYRLSSIENGRANKKKNPYLLTAELIKVFSNCMKCETKELIFGNYIEREENVRLFLLAIIMNSEKDEEEEYIIPFMDFLFRNKNRTITLKENEERYISASGIMKGLNKVEEKYPFFTSGKIYKKYQNLLGVPSLRIELISNLLIKLLMGDFEFANYYILRMSSLCKINGSNEIVYSFIENKGMIGGALIENKHNFYVFANAFEKMWKRHKGLFMEYFEGYLFNKRIKPELKYKEINNKLFYDIIIDPEFSRLIFSVIEKDRFSIKTMDGHYLFYQHLLNRYVDKEIENSIEHPY
ncbi:helix-turn-helix domain-containing protein [Lederbergia lenta]|uniref:HTH cro/C1-type domain-containing protein n=1 Tax=Lederbergia lenta TaxID=1467 RepID=A0A2X4VGG3_LEDLE|nr:helix-turn-helix transcriptional regulator [Lederbergia lenta]MEC2326351.1 helix-turn-helix transcriptional regulator [Lederbergia lenta]SQI51337.1 Uncharacterised protein [Lederbergia lenta]